MMSTIDRSKAPAVTGFGNLVMPECRELTLDNGLKLHVVDQGSQEVCSLSCVWNGGMVEAPSGALANLTVRLLQEGCTSHSGEEIADIIDFNGARLFSSVANHHSLVKLYTLNSKAGALLPLLSEIFTTATLPEQALEMHRENAAKNLEITQSKVEYRASCAINRLMMGAGHPGAKVDTPDAIRKITVDDVRGWYDAAISPSNFEIYLAGRVTPQLEDNVNRTLGAIKADINGGVPIVFTPMEPTIGGYEHVKVDGALQSAVRMYVPTIGRKHPDYVPLRILIIALGGYFGSRLISNIREDKGLTYGISSNLLGYPEGGLIGIASSTDNANVALLIEETKKELSRLRAGDFADEEIERLRQYVMSSLASMLDSPFEIMEYYINNKLSSIPEHYFEEQVRTVQNLNREVLTRVAREYIFPDKFTTVVAGQ